MEIKLRNCAFLIGGMVTAAIVFFMADSVAQTPSPSASASAASDKGSPASEGSGIEGSISLGPIHGGPIRVDRPSTAPVADKEFFVLANDKQVASFKTDAEGKFRVSVPPGHYTVSAKQKQASRFGRFGPFEVDVAAGQMTPVQWHCDTGMR